MNNTKKSFDFLFFFVSYQIPKGAAPEKEFLEDYKSRLKKYNLRRKSREREPSIPNQSLPDLLKSVNITKERFKNAMTRQE